MSWHLISTFTPLPDLTERKIQDCVKMGISADFSGGIVTGGSVHFKSDECETVNPTIKGLYVHNYPITRVQIHTNTRKSPKPVRFLYTDERSGKALVDEVITSVKGGTLETAVAMRAKLNAEGVMDISTYQAWARTIAEAPALLHSDVGATTTHTFYVTACQFRDDTTCFHATHKN